MNIGTDRQKWAIGEHYKDFNFYNAGLYLSVFICVYLCSSVVKILNINFKCPKKYQMTFMPTVYCHLGNF